MQEFLTLKEDSLRVHGYVLKFTETSRYAPKMVKDMRSTMSLFVAGFGYASSKENRVAMLIGDMDILKLRRLSQLDTISETKGACTIIY